jgi:hypothetical protein
MQVVTTLFCASEILHVRLGGRRSIKYYNNLKYYLSVISSLPGVLGWLELVYTCVRCKVWYKLYNKLNYMKPELLISPFLPASILSWVDIETCVSHYLFSNIYLTLIYAIEYPIKISSSTCLYINSRLPCGNINDTSKYSQKNSTVVFRAPMDYSWFAKYPPPCICGHTA